MSVPTIPKRKKTTGNYFTEETQQWIEKYIKEDNEQIRNIIFTKYLHKPFKKIAEIYYNTLSVPYIQSSSTDAINDCITHMITNSIYRFKGDRGKAFSYLSITARNYYIQLNKSSYVRYKNRETMTTSYDESSDMLDYHADYDEYANEIRLLFVNFRLYLIDLVTHGEMVKSTRIHIQHIINYMDDYDFDDLTMSKFINTNLLKKYGISRLTYQKIKIILKKLWHDYKDEYYETNEFPVYKKSFLYAS